MKKIKSVKLKREYRDTSHIMTEGQYGVKWFDEEEKKTFWKFRTQRTDYSFCESTITGNKTELFEIEYEEEKKYIDVRITFGNNFFTTSVERVLRETIVNAFDERLAIYDAEVTLLEEGIL